MDTNSIIDRLIDVIEQRKKADPAKSYVAKLYKMGTAKIAQKVGEEAVELALASVNGTDEEVTDEAADLMFHMMVLLADKGLSLRSVAAELARREGLSGLEEKASRPKD